jgi:phytanoyl-CoA hydroxylase
MLQACNTKEIVREYERDGFTVFRNVIDEPLISEARYHVEWLIRKYPDLRPEHFHHPLMRDDAFWVRLVTDDHLLDIAELFLGPNLACFTAHYICKPPFTGQPVFWHQDGSYWKLEPMQAVTLWLAVDASTPENGCLKMIPGSHKIRLQKPQVRKDTPNMLYSSANPDLVEENIRNSSTVDIVLQPGDVSVHHPNILHCSEANTSSKRRCGLDMGFIQTSTRISNRGLYLDPLLVRGKTVPGINNYRRYPLYAPGTSIPFEGFEMWNSKIIAFNAENDFADSLSDTEAPIMATRRMIERLQEGTVKE